VTDNDAVAVAYYNVVEWSICVLYCQSRWLMTDVQVDYIG